MCRICRYVCAAAACDRGGVHDGVLRGLPHRHRDRHGADGPQPAGQHQHVRTHRSPGGLPLAEPAPLSQYSALIGPGHRHRQPALRRLLRDPGEGARQGGGARPGAGGRRHTRLHIHVRSHVAVADILMENISSFLSIHNLF